MKNIPKVGDEVTDYVYSCGITFKSNILSIKNNMCTIGELVKPKLSFLQRLFGGKDPGNIPPQEIFLDELYYNEDNKWSLDTFL